MIEPVVKSVLVPCDPAKAFDVFTSQIASWWPVAQMSMTAATAPLQSLTLAPRVGGDIVEVAADGAEHIWGKIVTFDPGKRLVIEWHVGRPYAEATLIDISFTGEGDGTRVTLTHSRWEALGENADGTRAQYNTGWVLVFEDRYATAARAA